MGYWNEAWGIALHPYVITYIIIYFSLFPGVISAPTSSREVFDEIERVITKPSQFCYALGLPKTRCNIIEMEHKSSIWEQVQEMTDAWFQSTTEPTWGAVVRALNRMNLQQAAKRIADKYGVKYHDEL